MGRPRKAKAKAKSTEETAARPGRNGFDPEQCQGYVNRIEACHAEIDLTMANARAACQPDRDDIKAIKKEASENGIPKGALSAIIRKRRLLAKAEKVPEALNENQQESFDQIQHALGMIADLPLGAAVLEKANGGDAQTVS